MAKSYIRYRWTPVEAKDVSMGKLCTWSKLDVTDADGDLFSGAEICNDFEKKPWFKLGKSMCKNHNSNFQDNVK